MLKRLFFILSLLFALPSALAAVESQISLESVKSRLEGLQSSSENSQLAKELEETLGFLERSKKQQSEIDVLEAKIKNAPRTLQTYRDSIQKLTAELQNYKNSFERLSSNELESKQEEIRRQLQELQLSQTEVGSSLVSYRSALEQSRKVIGENNQQIEKLTAAKGEAQANNSLVDKYNAEINFLETNNKYNALLGQNIDLLISIEESKRSELNLKQQLLQKQLADVQDVLGANRIKAYEAQAKQAEQLKATNKVENPIIHNQLGINTDLSQYLVEQTQKASQLSQESLRAKNVLDSLVQTKRNIEEQISALQGTLVLSRVINQQKQSLPTESVIKSLAEDTAKLRVELFELSQNRDELYNLENVINELQIENKILFDDSERKTLNDILKDRSKILADLIKTLNSQLNLSNEIEITQQQIITISDELQNNLEQQSFWVKSNNPIDLDWLENFPKLVVLQVAELTRYLGFDNLSDNLLPTFAFVFTLLVIFAVIRWKKTAIKHRLSVLAEQVNTLKNDSHLHTPEAMLWTVVLNLPSTLLFLIISTLLLFLFFSEPFESWAWLLKASGYWLFFASVLSLLRPNGLAFRHFGMPQASNEIFHRIIKQSVWIVVLLLVSSIFSQIDSIGFINDVIGQVMTLAALALCLFVVRPLLDRGIREYENARNEDGTKRNISLFNLLRLVLFIVPVSLMLLIALGYYYTAVYLIEHIIRSYVVALVWVFGRYFVYRSLTISSRRMAYRRLQNKREKLREQAQDPSREEQSEQDKVIKISTVNQQIFRMADLIAWLVLFVALYAIWSDLVSVAYYLNGFVMWETTTDGKVETVTILNLLRSLFYVGITYILVKNIAGILEVTLFSRVKFSKGTPHTLTAVLTYIIVTVGCISAFTALGISWGKIQWIFTALSVGLGFGVREIFGSFVSGTILLFERPIRVGDKVTVGNFTGVITSIRLRSTTLVDDEHKEVVLPNQAFVTDRFINWTLHNTITRLHITMKIKLGADLNRVQALLFQAANEAEKVMQDPRPNVNLLHFGEGWIEHELTVYVPELDDRSGTRNFLHKRISELFHQHGIQIAFNQVDLHFPPENRLQAVEMTQNLAK